MRLMFSALLPKSLAGRMTLILVVGLLAAQLASLYLHLQDRASLMSAGHVHPGMMGMETVPVQFLWHVGLTLVVVISGGRAHTPDCPLVAGKRTRKASAELRRCQVCS